MTESESDAPMPIWLALVILVALIALLCGAVALAARAAHNALVPLVEESIATCEHDRDAWQQRAALEIRRANTAEQLLSNCRVSCEPGR